MLPAEEFTSCRTAEKSAATKVCDVRNWFALEGVSLHSSNYFLIFKAQGYFFTLNDPGATKAE